MRLVITTPSGLQWDGQLHLGGVEATRADGTTQTKTSGRARRT